MITNRKERYIYRDHLGSLDVITDDESMVQQRLSFNAWGERRNTQDWTVQDIEELLDTSVFQTLKDETTRGFTGHEMVDEVGIIHMNGRIYDAKLARFLQADPFIQAATNTQSYNRYSYTFNNPLNATDPSGYISGSLKKSIDKYASAIVSVAIVAFCHACAPEVLGAWLATTAAINAKLNGASGSQIFASAVLAFAGGAVGASGGEGAIYMSGVLGGISALMSGGNFGNGFVTSLASSYLGGEVAKSNHDLVRIAGASIIGGTSSKLTGGKFVSGAATGAFLAAVRAGRKASLLAKEKDQLIREYGNKIACTDCDEAIASALKASAQKAHRMASINKLYGDILKAGNIDLDANMKLAASMSLDELGAALTDKSVWNYKRNSSLIAALKSAGNYDANLLAEFGNVHAGMTYGAAGVRLDLALTAGGGYQAFSQNIRGGNFSAGAAASSVAGLGAWFTGMTAPTRQTLNWAGAGFTWGDNSDDIWPIIQGYCTTSSTCD